MSVWLWVGLVWLAAACVLTPLLFAAASDRG